MQNVLNDFKMRVNNLSLNSTKNQNNTRVKEPSLKFMPKNNLESKSPVHSKLVKPKLTLNEAIFGSNKLQSDTRVNNNISNKKKDDKKINYMLTEPDEKPYDPISSKYKGKESLKFNIFHSL